MYIKLCYHGNNSKATAGGKMLEPTERAKLCLPGSHLPQKEDFSSERALEWVVDWKPTNNEDLGGVKWCGEWLLSGLKEWVPLRVGRRRKETQWPWRGAGWVQVGLGGSRPGALSPPGPRFWDPAKRVRSCLTPSKGIHLCWWQLGLRGTPWGLPCSALGSCSVGLQLCVWSWWWRSCPSCFLQDTRDILQLQPRQELPTLWQVGSVFLLWKLQPSLSESVLKGQTV